MARRRIIATAIIIIELKLLAILVSVSYISIHFYLFNILCVSCVAKVVLFVLLPLSEVMEVGRESGT